jgi:hypothetical protein
MKLPDLLSQRRQAILDRAVAALERGHLAHYRAAGPAVSRDRMARLYDLVADAVSRRSLTALLRHSETIARERFADGFDLLEVQTAFNVLEEEIWRAIVSEIPPSGLADALGLVGTALGAGKDRLAATYVALASSTHTPTLDLRALFEGAGAGA